MTRLQQKVKSTQHDGSIANKMLRWYDRHARVLPWRAPPRTRGNPYHVWLSEIMLQQTTVSVVIPYFQKFIARWPTLKDLAEADVQDVLVAWAGLGYYSRAHRLHQCAIQLGREYGGRLPDDEATLLQLPGFGPYTAAAVAAIAFGHKANVVDGNIERILARLHAVETPLPQAKRELKLLAARYVPERRCGDYAQSLMDLGATLCTPRQPKCAACPLQSGCVAYQQGQAADFPYRAAKHKKPVRYTTAFVVLNKRDELFLCQRPPGGLLGGMMEVPSSPWEDVEQSVDQLVRAHQPITATWRVAEKGVRHIFSHFTLNVRVVVGRVERGAINRSGVWVPCTTLDQQALPSVMLRIVRVGRHALGYEGN